MHRLYPAVFLLATACAGVTETNVTPAPCMLDEDCGPEHRCEPLPDDHDAAPVDGGRPLFCQPR